MTKPLSELSQEEWAYMIKTSGISQNYKSVVGELASMLEDAGCKPMLFEDEEWKHKMAFVLLALKRYGQEVHDLEAPPGFEGFHLEFFEMCQRYSRAAELLAEGFDERNSDKIHQGLEQMQLAKECLIRSKTESRRILDTARELEQQHPPN